MSDSQQTSDNSELCYAMRRKDIEKVRWLLQNSNINVNIPILKGNTPLHYAVFFFNDLDIITMLLDKGANIHAINIYHQTPLWMVINLNKIEVAALLIKKGAVVAENLYSVLLRAICKNNFTIVELINNWIRSNPSIDLRTPLNTAIFRRDVKMIEYILPHCQFLEQSVKYIPKETVITPYTYGITYVSLLLKWNFTVSSDSNQDKDFIYAAVEKSYLPIVLQLLELGIDVNMVNSKSGLNLLTVACLNEHHEIVENLLKHGANVNVKISATNLRLMKRSSFYYYLQSFNELFPAGHQNQLSHITCLHIAALYSDSTTMNVLLKYNPTIDHEMAFNLTCIAARHGCDDIVRIFLDRGVDVTNTDSEGRSLLHYCISLRSSFGNNDSRYNIAKLVLEKAANINIQKPDTLLHQAIQNKFDAKFIALLLNHKFPVNAKNVDGWTPLHFACKIKSDHQLENIEVLLHHDADVNCTTNDLMTPLHFVCQDHNLEAVALLLKKGVNLNVTNKKGQTALHIVCQSKTPNNKVTIGLVMGSIVTQTWGQSSPTWDDRSESLIQLLLQYNANIDVADVRGFTPLTTAYLFNNKKAVKCLLKNHAKDDYFYSKYSTFFFKAISKKDSYMIEKLIKYGVDINCLNEENQTPLQNAIQLIDVTDSSSLKIVNLLETQVVKLEVAGLYVINKNFNLIYEPNDNEDYPQINILHLEAKCQQEIKKMKIKCIGNDKMTLYDLLKKNITILSRLDGIEEVQEALDLEVYDEEFPLYIDIIRNKVREAIIRYPMMNSATEYFYVNVCNYLPSECIDLILSYLKIKDLNMFIEAMKPLNN